MAVDHLAHDIACFACADFHKFISSTKEAPARRVGSPELEHQLSAPHFFLRLSSKPVYEAAAQAPAAAAHSLVAPSLLAALLSLAFSFLPGSDDQSATSESAAAAASANLRLTAFA